MKRILVLHDLHPAADNAAWRGAMLARANAGWLQVLHLSRFGNPAVARERLEGVAWRLQEHLGVAVLAQALRGSISGELRRAAEEADLVVMRAPSGLDAATGLHPLRVAQLSARPTLVVRTPANAAYRRVVVGEPDDGAGRLVAVARTLADGKEVPATTALPSAAALLERERSLFPDLVVVACAQAPALARRFLSLTRVDTLLLPQVGAGSPRARAVRGGPEAGPQPVPT